MKILLALIKSVFKDETYTPPLHIEQALYRFLAICSLRKNDDVKAIKYLEEMYDYTVKQAQGFNKIIKSNSPLLESYEIDFNYPNYEPKKILLEQLDKECFKSLSNDQSFQNLMNKINQLPE